MTGAMTLHQGWRPPWTTDEGSAGLNAPSLSPSSLQYRPVLLVPAPNWKPKARVLFCVFTGQFSGTENRVENIR